MNRSIVRYLNNNFDEMAILAVLIDFEFKSGFDFNEENQCILSALRHFSEEFRSSSIEQIGSRLNDYNKSQIMELVSNVKSIAYKMEFVKLENEDGDSIYASLYPDTNQPGFDVQLFDKDTGEMGCTVKSN